MELIANCGNCEYGFFSSKDIEEIQRCLIIFRHPNDKPEKNPFALVMVEEGCKSICEYYQKREDLREGIKYKICRE
jgi:hypothetical protein